MPLPWKALDMGNLPLPVDLSATGKILAVSPAEAARLMGIGRTMLYELIGTGKLRTAKFGSRRLVTLRAIEECLAAHELPQ
jgi:excisionase family DNA binding protein